MDKMNTSKERIEISVVSAVYNEAKGIKTFVETLNDKLNQVSMPYEMLLVDDGSMDSTLMELKELTQSYPELRVVELHRNVGQVNALSAGMTVARGKWIIMMDGDLQHDPSDILRFVERSKEDYDLIASFRIKRHETIIRKIITLFVNLINRFIVGIDIKDFGSAFRMFKSDIMIDMKDRDGNVHYNTPMLYKLSRKTIQLPIVQHKRKYGSSKWILERLVSHNLDFITASTKIVYLLMLVSGAGILTCIIFFLLSLFNVFENTSVIPAGVSLAFTSIQLAVMGILWRELIVTQNCVKGIPLFIIKSIWQKDNIYKRSL